VALVRSVIMLGLNYAPDHDPLAILKDRDRGAVSVYAQGEDYHEIIKPRLKAWRDGWSRKRAAR
jgi:epoxyqueuosine reductase